MNLDTLKKKVLAGGEVNREEALFLAEQPLIALCEAADEIRGAFCENKFDICTIINGKSGRCSEDCKYCAQSAHYNTETETYELLDTETLLEGAQYNAARGVLRYSIVTSGKALSEDEVEKLCESIKVIRQKAPIEICVSLGLLNEVQFGKLKAAGVTRVHNNLETSRRFFREVCTTHTYDEKIAALKAAKNAGLSICSGGIMGLGETMEDRIDMVLTQRELGVGSIPVNLLNPIKGTPYEGQPPLTEDEMCRIVAVFRFLIPGGAIRLAGGRGLLSDKGEKCFRSGANAAISGDMLTTLGITIQTDMQLIKKLNYVAALQDV